MWTRPGKILSKKKEVATGGSVAPSKELWPAVHEEFLEPKKKLTSWGGELQ